MSKPKEILIIAGPNGAGKTTFATEFLPNEAGCPSFINSDLIAAGLSPFEPERAALRAGRLMHDLMDEYLRRRESFAFETTLSGRAYARQVPLWRQKGFLVKLYFLQLPTAEFAVARVRQRVREGGHHVPDDVVRRRFQAGLLNFERVYKALANEWVRYDTSGSEPVLLDQGGY
jgi:predicted ABC-type ATPase